MPIYEYQCRQCGQQFEKIISHSQADKVTCAKCQGKAERRLSTFGVGAKGDAMGGCGTSACGYNPAMGRCEKPAAHVHGPGCGH